VVIIVMVVIVTVIVMVFFVMVIVIAVMIPIRVMILTPAAGCFYSFAITLRPGAVIAVPSNVLVEPVPGTLQTGPAGSGIVVIGAHRRRSEKKPCGEKTGDAYSTQKTFPSHSMPP
jgi:hypothetical protein